MAFCQSVRKFLGMPEHTLPYFILENVLTHFLSVQEHTFPKSHGLLSVCIRTYLALISVRYGSFHIVTLCFRVENCQSTSHRLKVYFIRQILVCCFVYLLLQQYNFVCFVLSYIDICSSVFYRLIIQYYVGSIEIAVLLYTQYCNNYVMCKIT